MNMSRTMRRLISCFQIIFILFCIMRKIDARESVGYDMTVRKRSHQGCVCAGINNDFWTGTVVFHTDRAEVVPLQSTVMKQSILTHDASTSVAVSGAVSESMSFSHPAVPCLRENTQVHGGDYKSVGSIATLEDCIEMCISEERCMSVTYVPTHCYLKETKYGNSHSTRDGVTSWLKGCDLGISVMDGTSFTADVPGFPSSYQFNYGEEKTETKTISNSYGCSGKNGKRTTCTVSFNKERTTIPYTMTWTKKRDATCTCKEEGDFTVEGTRPEMTVTRTDI